MATTLGTIQTNFPIRPWRILANHDHHTPHQLGRSTLSCGLVGTQDLEGGASATAPHHGGKHYFLKTTNRQIQEKLRAITHLRMHRQPQTHTHTHTHTNTPTSTHTRAHTHVCLCERTHTRAHKHTPKTPKIGRRTTRPKHGNARTNYILSSFPAIPHIHNLPI